MRNNIIYRGADELTYEIRAIVEFGRKLESLGIQIRWENIGDPVAKGQKVPGWIKEIIKLTITESDQVFGYSPTKGLLETREFIANMRNMENNKRTSLTPDDILFFNGLGDAISDIYTYLNSAARVIGPSPAYPSHSSAEGAHAGTHHITYSLDPYRNWQPDLDELKNKVKYNPAISGILIINPDNPTGMIFPEIVLTQIVNIAKEFDLFLVSDEIYANIAYGKEEFVPLYKTIDDVPAIVMRGLSKEVPWPGARCGWIEVYNKDKDPVFARYAKTIVDAKMLEVCSTTLPQQVLPKIFSDERYEGHLEENKEHYKRKAKIAYDILKDVPGIVAPEPEGAFYVAVVFEDGRLNERQFLDIKNPAAKELIEKTLSGLTLDKRFVYYLLGSRGICVVPLSGFNSEWHGFRMTLLEPDEEKFKETVTSIANAIKEYLAI